MKDIMALMLLVDSKSALLQCLLYGEGYGLELIQRVNDRSNGQVRLLQGRVYPALRELEADGLVESWEGTPIPERGGRPRRYYRLTGRGQLVAREQREAIHGLFGLAWETA